MVVDKGIEALNSDNALLWNNHARRIHELPWEVETAITLRTAIILLACRCARVDKCALCNHQQIAAKLLLKFRRIGIWDGEERWVHSSLHHGLLAGVLLL